MLLTNGDKYLILTVRILNPLSIFSSIITLTAFLIVISPFDYHSFKLSTYIYFITLIGITMAPFIILKTKNSTIKLLINVKKTFYLLLSLSFFGLSGVVLNLYNEVTSFSILSFAENRTNSNIEGASSISFVSQILSSLLIFLPGPILLISSRLHLNFKIILWAIFFLYCMSDLLFLGSRNRFVVSSIFLFVSYISFNNIKIFSYRSVKLFLPLATLGATFIFFIFALIYYIRSVIGMELDLIFILENSGYAKFVQPKGYLINFLVESESIILETFIASIVNILGYYLHGIFEMLYLVESFTEQRTYGLYSFFLYAKVLSALFEIADPTAFIEGNFIRYGIFTSFYGPLYYDFGYAGTILSSLIIGIVIYVVFKQASRGIFSVIMLFNFLISCIFLLFTFNILTSPAGQYIIIAWFIFLFTCLIFNPLQKKPECKN